MPSTALLKAFIFGFIAIYIGAQLIPELWYDISATTKYAICPNGTGAMNQKCTTNGTTSLFMAMVPWIGAVGLMVTAVSVFLIKGKRL